MTEQDIKDLEKGMEDLKAELADTTMTSQLWFFGGIGLMILLAFLDGGAAAFFVAAFAFYSGAQWFKFSALAFVYKFDLAKAENVLNPEPEEDEE